MRIRLVLLVTLAALASTAVAQAHTGPRCAIKDPVPPPFLINSTSGVAYLVGEFLNRCVDPVLVMGTYACLEEFDFPEDPKPRLVECHANVDTPVLIAPHETNVFMAAVCDYTTIPRWYRITGYAWSISLEAEPFKSNPTSSQKWSNAAHGASTKRFCHISKKGAKWKDVR